MYNNYYLLLLDLLIFENDFKIKSLYDYRKNYLLIFFQR